MMSKCMVSFHFALIIPEILVRDWYSFKFTGKLFHETLALNFNEFIPHFRVFAHGFMTGIPLLSEYEIFISAYVFHMKLGLSLFLDSHISMAKHCKCLWWIFNLLSKTKRSSYVVMYLLYTTCKVSFCTFSTLLHVKSMGNR